MKTTKYMLLLAACLAVTPVLAQTKPAPAKPSAEQPADNMQILREKLKADKKLLVAANIDLTEAEAKKFWPLYEEYQKELAKINDQLASAITGYAKEYNAGSLTDAKASQLLNQSVAIEESETKLKRAFIPKLAKVLPGRKVARYMQIENKVRALVKYEIAGEVPLAP
jgi:Spy/CpxP family protein refolding chaperone